MRIFLVIFSFFIQCQCFSQSHQKIIDSISYYVGEKNYIKGLKLSRQTAKKYLDNKEYAKYCEVTLKKSEIFYLLNDNEKSFENLFDVLKVTEKHNLTKLKIKTLEDIGHRYYTIFDYEKAKNYYHRSLTLAKKHNLIDPESFIYQRLYALHFNTESDSALYYLKKVTIGAKLSKQDRDLANSYNNYYAYYASHNEFVLARKYLDSALYYADKSKSTVLQTTVMNNLGYHYLAVEKDYKKAVSEYHDIIRLNSTDTASSLMADVFVNLSYGYEMLGDYKNAHFYFNKYNTATENIYQGNLKQAINDVETRYRIEKIESENKESQRIYEERQANNRKIIIIFVALFAFSVVLFYFFYQNLRLKQKNKIMELDRQVKQNIINASIDGQEIERKNIANTLHDSISALLSSAGLHLSAYMAQNPENNSEEIKKTKDILKDAHDNVRDLSHELMPPLLAKFGLFHALQDLAEKNSNSILQFEYANYVSDKRRYPEDFELKIYFIMAELFNNIMKHSKATKAYVTMEENNNQLTITVEDDGRGYDTSKQYLTDGFGLTQIKSRVKHLGGTITINSKINAGTLIFMKIQIPN